jgi:predicted signal transduction protein with EAL and GGDEF domain
MSPRSFCVAAESDEARGAADRVASAIAATTDGDIVAVTASVGFACWPADGDDAATLVARADQTLYDLKSARNGRAPR